MTMDVLAGGLRNLADEPRLAPRAAELRAFAADLEHRTHLDQWAEMDLLRSFVRPESLAPAPARGQQGRLRALMVFLRTTGPGSRSVTSVVRWLRSGLGQRPVRDGALEAVMGVLVFIPLLVTWVGLREAVAAYGELSKDDPKEATRPFLQLWQSGFGGHLSTVGRFENVAGTTVLFIVLLVLLAIWNARVRARTEREEAARSGTDEHLLGTLASLLSQAQFALVPHRSASPQQFGRELSSAAKRLSALTITAENSTKTLTATGRLIKQAADDLQAAARNLTAELPKFGAVAGRIETAVRDGQETVVRAGKDNATAAQGIADRIQAAGSTVETALNTLAAAQQTLAEKSEAVAQTGERASQALVASTARTNDAIENMREATERWDAVAAHWQEAADRIDAGIQSLTGGRGGAMTSAGMAAPGGMATTGGAMAPGGMATHTGTATTFGTATTGGSATTGGIDDGGWHIPAPAPAPAPAAEPAPTTVRDAVPPGHGALGHPSPPPPDHAPTFPDRGTDGEYR